MFKLWDANVQISFAAPPPPQKKIQSRSVNMAGKFKFQVVLLTYTKN